MYLAFGSGFQVVFSHLVVQESVFLLENDVSWKRAFYVVVAEKALVSLAVVFEAGMNLKINFPTTLDPLTTNLAMLVGFLETKATIHSLVLTPNYNYHQHGQWSYFLI